MTFTELLINFCSNSSRMFVVTYNSLVLQSLQERLTAANDAVFCSCSH